jgi:hypothetical protein
MSDSIPPPKTCLLYKSDATQASHCPCENGLSDFQSLVGGNIEPVRLYKSDGSENADLIMLVNDEGLLNDLPINLVASMLAKQTLRGDVVVVHKSYLN